MPSQPRATYPRSSSSPMTRSTVATVIVVANGRLSPPEFTPWTRPSTSTSGPPPNPG